MSTGLECQIRELAPQQWYYVLQDWTCPVGAWDWTEYATVVGPYPSADAAVDGLHTNEANPGGYTEVPFRPSEKTTRLLGVARKPERATPRAR